MVSEEGSDEQEVWFMWVRREIHTRFGGETFMKETARCSWEGNIKIDLKEMC